MHSADSYSCGGCRCSSPSRANSSNANWVWIALIFTAQRARPLVYYCHSLPHWIICILFLRKRKVTLSVGAPEVQLECIALDSSNSRRRLARASERALSPPVAQNAHSTQHTYTHKRKTESRSRVPLPPHEHCSLPNVVHIAIWPWVAPIRFEKRDAFKLDDRLWNCEHKQRGWLFQLSAFQLRM